MITVYTTAITKDTGNVVTTMVCARVWPAWGTSRVQEREGSREFPECERVVGKRRMWPVVQRLHSTVLVGGP